MSPSSLFPVHVLVNYTIIFSKFQYHKMDKELIRQREAFKKRALAQPTVEKRKLKTRDDSDEQASKKHKSSSKPKGNGLYDGIISLTDKYSHILSIYWFYDPVTVFLWI